MSASQKIAAALAFSGKKILGVEILVSQNAPADLKVSTSSTFAIATVELASASLGRKVVLSRLRWKRNQWDVVGFKIGEVRGEVLSVRTPRSSAVSYALHFLNHGY